MRAIGLALGCLLLGCADLRVATQATPGTDFSRFATYAQAPPAPHEGADRDRVRREIARVLAAKGYRTAPLEVADLRVAFSLGGEERVREKVSGDPDANYYVEENVVEGTLAIHVYASGRADPVWVGTARSDALRAGRAEDEVAGAVEAILRTFPPAADVAASGS